MANPWQIISSIFTKKRQRSSYDLKSLSLARALGLDGSVTLTEKSIMGITAYYAAVMAKAKDVSMMPWNVYENRSNGKYKAFNHPIYPLLKDSPHPNYSSQQFRMDLMVFKYIYGNGYARIERSRSGRVESFDLRHPRDIIPFKSKDDGLIYYEDRIMGDVVSALNMFHVRNFSYDGVKGESVMTLHRDSLKAGLASNVLTRSSTEKGFMGDVVIELPEGVKIATDADDKRIREGFKAKYSGPSNSAEPILMPGGAKFKRIGIPFQDAQFMSSREFSVEDMCRIVDIPPERVHQHKNSTNNNIEQQAQEYVTYGLQPDVTAIEMEMNRKAFPANERGRFYNKIEMKSLLRANLKDKTEFYKFMRFYGNMNADEIRGLEDMNPIPDGTGAEYLAQTSMIPLSMLKEFYQSQIDKNEYSNI